MLPDLKQMRVRLERFVDWPHIQGYIVEIPEEILRKTGTPAELDLSFAMNDQGQWIIALSLPAEGKGLYGAGEAADVPGQGGRSTNPPAGDNGGGG